MEKETFLKKHTLILSVGFFLGILVVLILILIYKFHFPGPISSDHSRWAEFGTLFGGVIGPISTLLTLLALVLTLSIQNKQLGVSSKVLVHQIQALKKQTFDFEFFEMLRSISNNVNALSNQINMNDSQVSTDTYNINNYLDMVRSRYRSMSHLEKTNELELIKHILGVNDNYYRNSIVPLVKKIKLAINYIHSSEVQVEKYHELLHAQLNENTMVLLFYEYLLIERFDENLDFLSLGIVLLISNYCQKPILNY